MKVLYLLDTLEVGGAEQSLLAILHRFRRVRPVMCHLYRGAALKPAYEAAGIPVVSLGIEGKYAFRTAVTAVARLIERELPDLVHTTLFRADIVGRMVCPRMGIPLVSSFVSDSYGEPRLSQMGARQRLKHRVVQCADRLTAQRVTCFTANSEATKRSNAAALGIPLDRITVIYRGRDPSSFVRTQRMPRTGGPPLILSVGRLLPSKGHEELIEAFACIHAQHPQARLMIAGDGLHRSRLEQLVRKSALGGSVELLGTRDDISDLLHAADIFVFASHYEGLPGALIEAMFAARPIVASDILVHRECVAHRESAWLVPVRDAAALAEAVSWMLKHPREAVAMGEAARAAALVKFNIDRIATQHEELYERLLRECVRSTSGWSIRGSEGISDAPLRAR